MDNNNLAPRPPNFAVRDDSVMHVYDMGIYWNTRRIEQIMERAIRRSSHKMSPQIENNEEEEYDNYVL